MAPIVSVVIPTYAHAKYVGSALESVFAQTFKDYEVIVVNDGSPDDTAQVLRPFASIGRIRYIEQTNRGQAAARNRGLAEARGKFVAFLDDDDQWPPHKLEWQTDAMERDPELVAVGGLAQRIDASGRAIGPLSDSARVINFDSLFDGNPFDSPGQILIRAEPLRAAGGFDSRIWGADDLDVLFALARRGRIVKEPLLSLFYRVHAQNASRDMRRMFFNVLAVVQKHANLLEGDKRRHVLKRGRRFAYRYAFSQMMRAARSGLRHGDLAPLRRLCGPCATMVKISITDPRVMCWMFRDVLPRRPSL